MFVFEGKVHVSGSYFIYSLCTYTNLWWVYSHQFFCLSRTYFKCYHMKTQFRKNISYTFCHLSRSTTKPIKWHVRPAKTHSNLVNRTVWSESSLSAWRALVFLANHWEHIEDWSDLADAQADLSLRWAYMLVYWFCHAAAHLFVSYVGGPDRMGCGLRV